MAHDVFISYAHEDKPTADTVCAGLEQGNVRCWIAPRDILPSAEWGESVLNAITASRLLVLVFSPHANASKQVLREVDRAVNRGLPILPFRIMDDPPSGAMEYLLGPAHWLDAMTPPVESHIRSLVQVVHVLLGKAVVQAPDEATIAPPPHEDQVLAPPDQWDAGGSGIMRWLRRKLQDRDV